MIVREEEELVPLDRSTESSAELVVHQMARAVGLGKRVAGGEVVYAIELMHISMQLVASGFGGKELLRACGLTEFDVIV